MNSTRWPPGIVTKALVGQLLGGGNPLEAEQLPAGNAGIDVLGRHLDRDVMEH